MSKFTLRINYPHSQKTDSNAKSKQLRKNRRLPIIAIGMKIDGTSKEKEYIALFSPPKDVLKNHLNKHKKVIFHDIEVIHSNIPTGKNKGFEFPIDEEFKNLGINISGFTHFKVFKENINAARHPAKGEKFEICGNKQCHETDKVIHKPKSSELFVCEECWNNSLQPKKIAA